MRYQRKDSGPIRFIQTDEALPASAVAVDDGGMTHELIVEESKDWTGTAKGGE